MYENENQIDDSFEVDAPQSFDPIPDRTIVKCFCLGFQGNITKAYVDPKTNKEVPSSEIDPLADDSTKKYVIKLKGNVDLKAVVGEGEYEGRRISHRFFFPGGDFIYGEFCKATGKGFRVTENSKTVIDFASNVGMPFVGMVIQDQYHAKDQHGSLRYNEDGLPIMKTATRFGSFKEDGKWPEFLKWEGQDPIELREPGEEDDGLPF